jgi:DNA invertase Pin-like site-specific DNA recombinase
MFRRQQNQPFTNPERPSQMIHGYARASTSGQSLAAQLDALAFCDQLHQETGSTRGLLQVLNALVDQLQPGDVLAVTRLDRLGRSVVGLIGLVQSLQQRGVGLRVLTGNIDTATAQGRFFLGVCAAFAELEQDLIQERTKEGMRAAQARGVKLGRPQALTPQKLESARELLKAGMSHNKAAQSLGVSRSALYRAFPQSGEPGQPSLF